MPKKWFGPILKACGCCYEEPPPPPPPPCACDDTSCFPEDALNFSRIRFQASLTDSMKLETMNQRLECETNCRNIINKREIEIEYSGFAAFNGTYEIPFYAYNDEDEVWEEADPTEVSCGVWFYPLITADITFTRTAKTSAIPVDAYGTYNDTGCITQFQQVTRTLKVAMETRSGELYILDPVEPLPAMPFSFGSGLGVPFITLDPPVVQRTLTQRYFECSEIKPNLVVSNNVDASQPQILSPFINVNPLGEFETASGLRTHLHPQQGMRFVNIDADPNRPFRPINTIDQPVGVSWISNQQQQPRRSGFYDSTIYPYGGPGIPQTSTICTVKAEQTTTEIAALDLLWDDDFFIANGSSFRVRAIQCNPFYPGFSSIPYIDGPHVLPSYKFAYNAFSSDFRVLLN